jgi:thioredoxin-related protein
MRPVFLGLIGLVYFLLSTASAGDFSRWYGYTEASRLAQREGRILMVYFWSHACPYCEQMNTFVLSDPGVSRLLEARFVVASVAVDGPEGQSLSRRLRALGTPTFVFLAPRGEAWEEIGRLFGSRPRAQFLEELRQVCAKGGMCE